MRVYTIPARYAPFLYDAVQRLAQDAARDAEYRADDDPRVRRYGRVPDMQIDQRLAGEVVLTIGVVDPSASVRAAGGALIHAPSTSAVPGHQEPARAPLLSPEVEPEEQGDPWDGEDE